MRTHNRKPRMTLTLDKCYRTADVKRFLGIAGNLSYDKYPRLVYVAGHGYTGASIVAAIEDRQAFGKPGCWSRPGPKGATRVAAVWTDRASGAERAEIQYQ